MDVLDAVYRQECAAAVRARAAVPHRARAEVIAGLLRGYLLAWHREWVRAGYP
jgi:hypothetical protein